jgi:predicted TIM-barrel fold metal-dependent hydrolase
VRYLYQFCCDKNIPVTAHCSDGGFAIVAEANDFTNPAKWACVLKEYPLLKLNLAHMGMQSNKKMWLFSRTEWRDAVLKLVADYPNVYADFSCAAFGDEYYKSLSELINNTHLQERILFGSDFMINLLWSPSYNKYIEDFCKTAHLADNEKNLFCSINPERFLFKGSSDKSAAMAAMLDKTEKVS